MAYILAAERTDAASVDRAFTSYRAYLAQVADLMPPGAMALATSDWYFEPTDPRCPHDGTLESLTLSEAESGSGKRTLDLTIRLLGAFHDGHLTLRYRDVSSYQLQYGPTSKDVSFGHRDWRYDEFRASPEGHVQHEIEWWGLQNTGSWLIEATDVVAEWSAKLPTLDAG